MSFESDYYFRHAIMIINYNYGLLRPCFDCFDCFDYLLQLTGLPNQYSSILLRVTMESHPAQPAWGMNKALLHGQGSKATTATRAA